MSAVGHEFDGLRESINRGLAAAVSNTLAVVALAGEVTRKSVAEIYLWMQDTIPELDASPKQLIAAGRTSDVINHLRSIQCGAQS